MCIEYIWRIIPKETPTLNIICTRCNNNIFICSNKFRINSNKKLSDVWLIYKCSFCENTWKMSILTRKKLSDINHNLFCGFQKNNIDLAWRYAFDKSIANYNRVMLNSNVKFEIIDHQGNYLDSTENTPSIIITSEYGLSISIKKVLQQKLNLSGMQVLRLHQDEAIVIKGHTDLTKKIGFGCKLLFNFRKWKI